ncbi:MAG TPA: hypothetical protein P5250_05635, partial [Bacteroidales bacterium]|nr:hypothetical protein [Bacteroidales bacterium]
MGSLLIIPTFIKYGISGTGGTELNLTFNFNNIKNLITILTRYFSLASYEIPYMLGANTHERLAILKNKLWLIPSAIFLLIIGWLQVVLFIMYIFKKPFTKEFKTIKIITLVTFFIIFISFFFSVKGPSSHTFYLVFPLVLFYSFYCYNDIFFKYKKHFNYLFLSIFILSFILYTGIIINNYYTKSLYKNRDKVKAAIEQQDYKILSRRRTDK